MWIVRRADVGRLAYGRLVRDGVIVPLLPGIALPLDISDEPPLRRHVLGECVPPGCQATGNAALWAHGMAPLPPVLHVRTPTNRHIRTWHTPLPVLFHGVGIARPGGAVADVSVAAADARRWPDLTPADALAQYGRRLAPVSRRAS